MQTPRESTDRIGLANQRYLLNHFKLVTDVYKRQGEGGWLNNPSFHGLSEQLYEYTSAAANNGSGFEGLGDNTYCLLYTSGGANEGSSVITAAAFQVICFVIGILADEQIGRAHV